MWTHNTPNKGLVGKSPTLSYNSAKIWEIMHGVSEKVGSYWFSNRTECQKLLGAALETSDDFVSCCHLNKKASLFMNGESYALAKFIPPEHFRPLSSCQTGIVTLSMSLLHVSTYYIGRHLMIGWMGVRS